MYEIVQPPISLIDIFHDIIHQKMWLKNHLEIQKVKQFLFKSVVKYVWDSPTTNFAYDIIHDQDHDIDPT